MSDMKPLCNNIYKCLSRSGLRYTSVGRLVGLVVKASASRAEDPRFDYRLRRDFSGVGSYQ